MRPPRRPTVTAAEKAQAREVSLRRIARLFAPHHRSVAVVTAIIVVSSAVSHGLAVPAARRHRRRPAPPRPDAAGLARRRHGRRRRRDRRARRRPDLDLHVGRPAGHAPAAHRRLRPPAAPVDRLLHPHPHRRGAVADHQRHRRHAVRRHLDRDLDRLQPDHRGRHAGRDARAVLAALAGLAGRAAAGDLPDPPGRPHAPRDHRRAAARAGRPQRHHRGGRCRSAACSWPRRWAPARRWSSGSPPRRPG